MGLSDEASFATLLGESQKCESIRKTNRQICGRKMSGSSSTLSNFLLGEHNSTDSWEDRKWKYNYIFLILCLSICIWILSEAKSQTRYGVLF